MGAVKEAAMQMMENPEFAAVENKRVAKASARTVPAATVDHCFSSAWQGDLFVVETYEGVIAYFNDIDGEWWVYERDCAHDEAVKVLIDLMVEAIPHSINRAGGTA